MIYGSAICFISLPISQREPQRDNQHHQQKLIRVTNFVIAILYIYLYINLVVVTFDLHFFNS